MAHRNYEHGDRGREHDDERGSYERWERQRDRGDFGRGDWRDRDFEARERRPYGDEGRASERHGRSSYGDDFDNARRSESYRGHESGNWGSGHRGEYDSGWESSGRHREREDYDQEDRRFGRSGFGGASGGTYGRYGPGYGESIPGRGLYGRHGRGNASAEDSARGGYGRYGAMFGSGYEVGYVGGYGPSTGYGYGPARQYVGGSERGDWQQSGSTAGIHNYAGRGPRGYRRSDERIREEVNEALMRHPDIDASDIEVRVANGEVTLTGVVENRRAKRLAEDLVEDVWGIDDVRNELKVRRGFLASLTGEKADERDVTQPAVRENSGDSRRSTTSGTSTTTGT